MKSILYVGATLMIGASIYGFVDYKKSSHKKQFTGMYEEQKTVIPVEKTQKIDETAIIEKDPVQHAVVKKQIKKMDATVPAVKPIVEKITGETVKGIEELAVDSKIASNSSPEKKLKKKKKLNRNMFSRAPIREEPDLPAEKAVEKSNDKQ